MLNRAGAAAPTDLDLKAENGSGTGTAAVAASGNQGIDGLLSGVRWNGGSITYSFPDSAADYQAGHPESFTNAQQINAAQQLAAHFALNAAVYTQPASSVGSASLRERFTVKNGAKRTLRCTRAQGRPSAAMSSTT